MHGTYTDFSHSKWFMCVFLHKYCLKGMSPYLMPYVDFFNNSSIVA